MNQKRPLPTALLAGFLVFGWGFCPCALARALGASPSSDAVDGSSGSAAPCCPCCRGDEGSKTDTDAPRHRPDQCPTCETSGCSKSVVPPSSPAELARPEAVECPANLVPALADFRAPSAWHHPLEAVSPGPPERPVSLVRRN